MEMPCHEIQQVFPHGKTLQHFWIKAISSALMWVRANAWSLSLPSTTFSVIGDRRFRINHTSIKDCPKATFVFISAYVHDLFFLRNVWFKKALMEAKTPYVSTYLCMDRWMPFYSSVNWRWKQSRSIMCGDYFHHLATQGLLMEVVCGPSVHWEYIFLFFCQGAKKDADFVATAGSKHTVCKKIIVNKRSWYLGQEFSSTLLV